MLNRVLTCICDGCVHRELLSGSPGVKMMGWKTRPSFIFAVTLDYRWMNAFSCEPATPFPSKPSPHIPGSQTTGYSDAKGSGRNTQQEFVSPTTDVCRRPSNKYNNKNRNNHSKDRVDGGRDEGGAGSMLSIWYTQLTSLLIH